MRKFNCPWWLPLHNPWRDTILSKICKFQCSWLVKMKLVFIRLLISCPIWAWNESQNNSFQQCKQILKERLIEAIILINFDSPKLWFRRPPKNHTFSQSHYRCPLKLPEEAFSLYLLAQREHNSSHRSKTCCLQQNVNWSNRRYDSS